ncbi:MAG TPA: glycosyltransferase family 2 protein [Opitutaceae bacterium]|nr:glycosyltransferase family 2 protein [Opitutaceae bacterium]
MTSNSHAVILPTYNSGPALATVVAEVWRVWQPVIVVVDGSTDQSDHAIRELATSEPGLTVVALRVNSGKGAAVLAGARLARARGHTHVLVMDADGQHPTTHIGDFMRVSEANPGTLVLGRPQFPPNIPPERLHGRKLSVGLVRFEIGGRGIDDPLFGFRVYPLDPLLSALEGRRTGRRYDFDTEVAVRLFWAGVPVMNVPAPVRYFSRAEGGISHFRYGRDNARLAWMHVRLITEFLCWRWPGVVRRRWRTARRESTVTLAPDSGR